MKVQGGNVGLWSRAEWLILASWVVQRDRRKAGAEESHYCGVSAPAGEDLGGPAFSTASWH